MGSSGFPDKMNHKKDHPDHEEDPGYLPGQGGADEEGLPVSGLHSTAAKPSDETD